MNELDIPPNVLIWDHQRKYLSCRSHGHYTLVDPINHQDILIKFEGEKSITTCLAYLTWTMPCIRNAPCYLNIIIYRREKNGAGAWARVGRAFSYSAQ